jgi:hypothetical protein
MTREAQEQATRREMKIFRFRPKTKLAGIVEVQSYWSRRPIWEVKWKTPHVALE